MDKVHSNCTFNKKSYTSKIMLKLTLKKDKDIWNWVANSLKKYEIIEPETTVKKL